MSLTKPIFKPFLQRLATPTDTASLVLLRVSFGLLMLWEVIRFFYFGWVDELYAQPTFHFKYEWFTWVEAWPGYGMHLHFAALGVLAVLITLGFGGLCCCASFCIFCKYRAKANNAIDDANLIVDRVHDPIAA